MLSTEKFDLFVFPITQVFPQLLRRKTNPETNKLRRPRLIEINRPSNPPHIARNGRHVCHVSREKKEKGSFSFDRTTCLSDRSSQNIRIIKLEISIRMHVRVYVCKQEDIRCSKRAISSSFRVFAAVTMAGRKVVSRFPPKLSPISS